MVPAFIRTVKEPRSRLREEFSMDDNIKIVMQHYLKTM